MTVRVAVIGVGHLGQAHARILASQPDVELVGVADVSREQAEAVAARHGAEAFTHFGPLIERVDAACIVVPTIHHHSVGRAFLERGVHVLIEKPLAPTVEQADALVAAARNAGCVLQVGHIERFNPAFETLSALPMRPKFIECERIGPFTGRSNDIGAVLDLMVHDLDLIRALDRSPLIDVDALGVSVLGGHEDLCTARLQFASGCVANVTANRIAPAPRRTMRVWSAEGVASIDFATKTLSLVQPGDELRRNGLALDGADVKAREAVKTDLYGKHLQLDERVCTSPIDQLTGELRDFIDCVKSGGRPRVSGDEGRNAVELACRVLESLNAHLWEGTPDGPCGPLRLPKPAGPLIVRSDRAAA